MPVAEVTQGGVTVSILSADGQIHAKDNALQIKFQDPGAHPVAAENVKVELNMNMPGMVMHSGAKIKNDGMGITRRTSRRIWQAIGALTFPTI